MPAKEASEDDPGHLPKDIPNPSPTPTSWAARGPRAENATHGARPGGGHSPLSWVGVRPPPHPGPEAPSRHLPSPPPPALETDSLPREAAFIFGGLCRSL